MRYLLMIYTDEADLEDAPQTAAQLMAEYATFTKEMVRRGVVRGGERLRPTWAATSVQVRDGDVMIGDGPFVEAKQQIGGYCLIECADLDEALEVAAKIPSARQGTIGVRPIWGDLTAKAAPPSSASGRRRRRRTFLLQVPVAAGYRDHRGRAPGDA